MNQESKVFLKTSDPGEDVKLVEISQHGQMYTVLARHAHTSRSFK